jgi:hypothetical protein
MFPCIKYNPLPRKSGIKEGYLHQEGVSIREAVSIQKCDHCISGRGLLISGGSGKEN